MTARGTRKIRYGIIGFGRFAERAIAPAIQSSTNSELVALQKRSGAAAKEKAAAYGVRLAFQSVDELVAHPDIDAVFIVSANALHCPETLAAAKAGKHVLVEKPMALNCGEAEMMIEACANHGVKLQVGHMVRLSPVVARIREIIASGALGSIAYARAEFMYDGRMSKRGWLLDRAVAGGGPVFDIGVHCLDTLRYVLQDEPVSAKGQLSPEPSATATETTAELALRFSKGTVASVVCSYQSPIRRRAIEIIGTEGIIAAPDFTAVDVTIPLRISLGSNDQIRDSRVENIAVPNLYIEEVSRFSSCILDDREPELSGMNGLINQRIIDSVMTG